MIETRDLTKTFDNFTAVDSLNRRILRITRSKRSRENHDDQSSVNVAVAYERRNPHRRTAADQKAPGSETEDQRDHPGIFHASGYEYG